MPAKYGSQDSPSPAPQGVKTSSGTGVPKSTSGGTPPMAPSNTSAKYGEYGACRDEREGGKGYREEKD